MNHHRILREIAKIGTGLVLADLIGVFWLSSAGLFPLSLLGVTWASTMIPEIIVFDGALLILLAHFGWSMRLPVTSPSERTLLSITGVVFLVVALAHLLRLMFGLQVILGGFEIPMWLSWAGVLVAAYLSYASFHFARRSLRR